MPDPSPVQNALTAKDVLVPAITIIGSFAGAWFAAKLALGNYYRQQIWERKAEAYTVILEAIFTIERWFEKQFDATAMGKELSHNDEQRLRDEGRKAEEDLEKCLAGHAWMLPSPFCERSYKMIADAEAVNTAMWQEFLDKSIAIFERATDDLRRLVRQDLRIK
jgi:hypothetical protein